MPARRQRRQPLRFLTSEGELPACGHGTIAALAFLANRAEGRERFPSEPAHGGARRHSTAPHPSPL
nr:PhzF family phenazine biosynthesis protein [Streptomyces sp. IMTB 2501]